MKSEADFFVKKTLAPIPIVIKEGLTEINDISNKFNISIGCSIITHNALNKRLG